jgi:hypothetical protein
VKSAAALAPTVRWFHCLYCGEEFHCRKDHDFDYCRWQRTEEARELDKIEQEMILKLEYQA